MSEPQCFWGFGELPGRGLNSLGRRLGSVRVAPVAHGAGPLVGLYKLISSPATIKVPEDRDLLLSQIGLRITRRRQDLGLTVTALANKLGVAPTNVSRIEYGKQNVTIDTLCKLANALDTTVLALLGGGSATRR
jgi:DNA-binding XRE family transcriptional regulator